MPPSFVMAGVGDLLMLHPVTAHMTDPASAGVVDLLRSADAAIASWEVSGFDEHTAPDARPQSESGGLWLNAGVDGIADLRLLGINMVARAANHTTDFGIPGMEATDRLLSQHQIAHAGTGATLGAARAPTYRSTRGGRVALISATDSTPRMGVASYPRPDMAGRPGVNAIRRTYVKVVDAATFHALVAVVSAAPQRGIAIAHFVDDGRIIHGLGAPIQEGKPEHHFVLSEADVADNLQQVRAARMRADYVVFALHTHLPNNQALEPPASIREFARKVIDAGADVVFAHGPHMLRGIELHEGRPIFYSLGNFIHHLMKLDRQPSDFFEQRDFNPSNSLDCYMGDYIRFWDPKTDTDPWDSMVVRIVYEPRSTTVELHPIELCATAKGGRQGTPRLAGGETATRILDRLQRLSARYGTDVVRSNGIGIIRCAPVASA